ncbi:hypothetical protein FN846DRAFT_914196 [Sphaerosporella brunnea]|uniref:P-loop containing nucleoside triphosphate hydrolase protein n=1 Tax=Sphaerosporella brunnea TaxID=1250544 RepID=A0A5J5EF14_9PEZI|nr:hypothetical protein FN846DRAFT_914196 [Sphaerosporella brunnea]
MGSDNGDDGSSGSGYGYGANLLGAMSLTTIVNQVLEQAGPVLKTQLGVDLNLLITLFVLGTMAAAGWHYCGELVEMLLETYFQCTVRISSDDTMFAALMEYLDEQGVFATTGEQAPTGSDVCAVGTSARLAWYATPTRNLDANLDKWNASYWDSDSELEDDDDDDDAANYQPYMRVKKKTKYAPMTGHSHYFYFKPTGHTVKIWRTEAENNPGAWWRKAREYVSLRIYGRDAAPLKALLQRVCDRENHKNVGKTIVYKAARGADGDSSTWTRCFSRASRPLHSVILDEEQKEEICQDMAEYLMPATSKWYSNRGLPYRRGYLLYGPPGTGKTSLTVALAGRYGLQVYSLSLSAVWMNDDTLAHLFSRLPKTCIVLLEDIDACGVTREGSKSSDPNPSSEAESAPNPSKTKGTASDTPTRVTFSGLLNAIDGVASKEGRLLIMTTNHRERLDDALIRPGRVDLQIKFDFADKLVVYNLFKTLYTVEPADKVLLKFPENFPDEMELMKLATAFAAKVPEGKFSPAEVQGLLLKHKKDPRKAVEVVEDWVVQKKNEQSEKERKEMAEKKAAAEKAAAEKEKKAAAEKEKEKEKKKEPADPVVVAAPPKINGVKAADSEETPTTNGEKEEK